MWRDKEGVRCLQGVRVLLLANARRIQWTVHRGKEQYDDDRRLSIYGGFRFSTVLDVHDEDRTSP